MQHNLVDLIVYLAKRLRMGDSISDIMTDGSKKYDKSEISAAYSWILQRYPPGKTTSQPDTSLNGYKRLAKEISARNKAKLHHSEDIEHNHRVLHYAERLLITPDAYGYLLELVEIEIIDQTTMEAIIDKVMFHSAEQITLESVKLMIQEYLFESQKVAKVHSSFLRGSESIN
jgi:uncharacterized protein Smg (DUF494 family)